MSMRKYVYGFLAAVCLTGLVGWYNETLVAGVGYLPMPIMFHSTTIVTGAGGATLWTGCISLKDMFPRGLKINVVGGPTSHSAYPATGQMLLALVRSDTGAITASVYTGTVAKFNQTATDYTDSKSFTSLPASQRVYKIIVSPTSSTNYLQVESVTLRAP